MSARTPRRRIDLNINEKPKFVDQLLHQSIHANQHAMSAEMFNGYGEANSSKPLTENINLARNSGESSPLIVYSSPSIPLEQKNPISRLQEFSVKNGFGHPVYTDVGEEGPSHARRFSVSVTVAGRTTTGQGNTKKAAKTAAAELGYKSLMQPIDSLTENGGIDSIDCLMALTTTDSAKDSLPANQTQALVTSFSQMNMMDPIKKPGETNIVQLLINHCQKNGCLPPVYEQISVGGEPHIPVFTFRCSIPQLDIIGEGSARNKQSAKRESAADAYRKLFGYPEADSETAGQSNEITTHVNPMNAKRNSMRPLGNSVGIEDDVDAMRKSWFFEELENRAVQIEDLLTKFSDKGGEDYNRILKMIVETAGGIVRYRSITNETNVHKYLIEIVHQHTHVLTSYGRSAESKEIAVQLSAKKAVQMLEIYYQR